ncbi:DUF47 domain-containing protein [Accumulibacter sp.]|uniref:DUF47 domain-containing protein n=1 Tax=Accumulibacter sp. TaxID=2053492 RepID=UPI0025DF0745|nr:DUF47 family protein [Accumulibacter sp.]MCM8596823.1 DUF47 family protein [Accumulibacter sp.]MCM8624643.1 DUF47 family protein [Accumulibacter sp.]MDS4050971.1 DUF47 family protein [Accumulibacter sp.]
MLPKRKEFFDLLAAHCERVEAGASAMLRLVSSMGVSKQDVASLVEEINMNEASSDKIKADMIELLHKAFVTPLNRDQVYQLTLDIDRIMNCIQDVAMAVSDYNITESTRASHELAAMAVEACSRLTRAMAALNKDSHSPETMSLCEEIERIEEKSVAVMYQAIKALYDAEGDDAAALRAYRLQELYALQEKVFRASKKTAQSLEEILLETA